MSKTKAFLPDLLISVPAILLLCFGVLVIYSSDVSLAIQQAVVGVLGLIIFWALSFIDFEFYGPYLKFLYWGILILLVVVFLLGIETRGAVRWIPLVGFKLQPSELAKPILILVLAQFWSKHPTSWKNISISLLMVLPIAGLIFKQPDLGTALTIMAIWALMLIGANISLLKILAMSLISVVLTPVLWFFLQDYQKYRFLSFLSPNSDPLGSGYNVIQSTIAVGSGEFLGRGLGRGTQSRLQFLPEFRTDFIFSSIAEEFGFLGSMIVLILYGTIVTRGLMLIAHAGNKFYSLLIFGVLGMLFFQIMVNIGMNIGVMPVTGITLPLLSYGGSSLIATLISLSFIASVSRFVRPSIDNSDTDV